MLVIRLQRTGRSGRPMYRLVVQDSKTHPSKGRVVSFLGQYDPHSKELNINKADVEKFLSNGAQPSQRVIRILTTEGVKMPKWVEKLVERKGKTKNAEKWRKFQPKEAPAPAGEASASEPVTEVAAPAEEEAPKAE